jgi:hypothetical protein
VPDSVTECSDAAEAEPEMHSALRTLLDPVSRSLLPVTVLAPAGARAGGGVVPGARVRADDYCGMVDAGGRDCVPAAGGAAGPRCGGLIEWLEGGNDARSWTIHVWRSRGSPGR